MTHFVADKISRGDILTIVMELDDPPRQAGKEQKKTVEVSHRIALRFTPISISSI
jgi:hypothetical protein